MKPLLFIFFIVLLAGCADNRREAIVNICKGVNSTEKTCRSAVGLAGKCANCEAAKESADLENTSKTEISTFELQENSMVW